MTALQKDSTREQGKGTVPASLGKTTPNKMGKYRSRFSIAATILEVAQAGNATKTRLMYGSFLSFAQINDYLKFLMANGLITRNDDTRTFALTEKGLRFVHVYDEIAQLIPLDEPIPAVEAG